MIITSYGHVINVVGKEKGWLGFIIRVVEGPIRCGAIIVVYGSWVCFVSWCSNVDVIPLCKLGYRWWICAIFVFVDTFRDYRLLTIFERVSNCTITSFSNDTSRD